MISQKYKNLNISRKKHQCYFKGRATSKSFEEPLSSQKFLVLIYRPRKDERLSRPWSHPAVLNTGPMDWESSALTTRPLYVKYNSLRHADNRKYFSDLSHEIEKKRTCFTWRGKSEKFGDVLAEKKVTLS